NPDLVKTLFLRADAHFVLGETGAIEPDILVSNETADRFRRTLDTVASRPETPAQPLPYPTEQPNPDAQQRYQSAVAEAVTRMKRGEFRKVVLSRTKTVLFDEIPDVVQLVEQLGVAYPNAFISAVWLPDVDQIWISATPERLVSTDAQGIFRTVSLAGTQSAIGADGHRKAVSEAVWTHKEIEEQALVSRYIIDCFKKIRLREYVEEGPKTVVAGNLMHLRTDFSVDTQAVNFPQLGTVMLRLLHPTSAVCGMPRDAALTFIQHHETHNREFYSGFLGPINIDRESALFVQLRCLKLEGQTATLYAGAGLTEESVPAREWLETELKCGTLLNVLQSIS
ncbi:MAG: chorismate-binding protein, partial [Bacteroidetes bacterium]|nr:chorismate-binding protein [Fibrella sp.]